MPIRTFRSPSSPPLRRCTPNRWRYRRIARRPDRQRDVYRHFPTREALLSGSTRALERYCAIAEDVVHGRDSVTALRDCVTRDLRTAGDEPRSGRSARIATAVVATRRRTPGPPPPGHRSGVQARGAQRQGARRRIPRRPVCVRDFATPRDAVDLIAHLESRVVGFQRRKESRRDEVATQAIAGCLKETTHCGDGATHIVAGGEVGPPVGLG